MTVKWFHSVATIAVLDFLMYFLNVRSVLAGGLINSLSTAAIKKDLPMLFLVHMQVSLPHDLPPDTATEIKAREKAYAQDLQRKGKWQHLWRIVGEYANYSVFDVQSNDELQELLSNLPLFPYMKIQVTPLAKHPSAI
jgi:muconolactone D-isomerase